MKSERGFTLVELMIYSALSVVVLMIVGGMIINSLTSERLVRTSTEAANTGQLVAQSVTKGVRLSRDLIVDAPTADTQVLMALIVDDAVSEPVAAHCQAWYFGNGVLRTTTSPTAIPIPLTESDVADWMLLADGVEQVGTTPVFDVTGLTAKLTMQLSTGEGRPILIDTTAVSRQPADPPTEVEALCF